MNLALGIRPVADLLRHLVNSLHVGLHVWQIWLINQALLLAQYSAEGWCR